MLALHLVPGLGPRLTAALLERFGTACAVCRATAAELAQVPYLGRNLAAKLAASLQTVDVDSEIAKMAQHHTELQALGSSDYPPVLAAIPNPPHLIYRRGRLKPCDAKAVAIVGSRGCSTYGRRATERLAADLARSGFTIISGLARGIDAAAHRGALETGGRTLAVLAGGLSRIYPPEHEELAAQVQASGALLSEAPMELQPLPSMFPARNRIISGLSQAVVVVEAAQRSGALITAHHALQQGRTVFAVPGPIDGAASAGTNDLIRQGAILCRGASDVIEELAGLVGINCPVGGGATIRPELDAVEQQLCAFLTKEPRHLDDIVQSLGFSVPRLTGLLLRLELKRVVRRLPGNRYECREIL
jgi:DNA processing protein